MVGVLVGALRSRPGRSVRCLLAAVATGVVVLLVSLLPSVAFAQPAAPGNDNYLSSWIIPGVSTIPMHRSVAEVSWSLPGGEDTTAATTQSDLFDPDSSGLPFAGGGPEPLECDGTSYGNTVWFDLHPDVPVGVQLVASGFPTVIALYQYDARTAQLVRSSDVCHPTSALSNTFTYPGDLLAGKAYTVQIGGLVGPSGVASGMLGVTVNIFPDHDRDGVPDGVDACPFLPGVPQFAGCPPTLNPRPMSSYTSVGSEARLDSLIVGPVPGGARVEVRCRACGMSQVLRAGAHASSVTMTRLAGMMMPNGAKLEIWVTKSAVGGHSSIYRYGAIGSYISYTVSSGILVSRSRVTRCLLPGSLTPRLTCT